MKNLLIHYVSTSESVNDDHYDKVCDQVSNDMLGSLLVENQYSKITCETTVATDVFRKMEAA